MTQKKTKSVKVKKLPASEKLRKLVINSLENGKAEDIIEVDLRGRTEIADYMIICSGRSSRQVTALADKISDIIKNQFGHISKIEGKSLGDWVLLDAGDVIVHIFRPEVRDFYQLEKMWSTDENSTSD